MRKSVQKPKPLNMFLLGPLHEYLTSQGWRKQKDDWHHVARPTDMQIEWWNRGADVLLVTVEDATKPHASGTVFTTTGANRATINRIRRQMTDAPSGTTPAMVAGRLVGVDN